MPQEILQSDATIDLWDEDIWDNLLAYIEEGRVIPVVGSELLQVEVDGKELLLDRYLAARLAAKYSVPAEALPADASLNQVVCHLLRNRKSRMPLYAAIRQIVANTPLKPPAALGQLARIQHFDLFVTMSFDSLLEQAINAARFGGRAETATLAYWPNNVEDLPCPKKQLDRPTVYHLLGKLSTAPEYVISDEDLLEFVFALQSDSHRPERLFDELDHNHLLILGGGFSDWLSRFFLRSTKRRPLSDQRTVLEIVADSRTHRDANLVLFLQQFSFGTRVFQGGGAAGFVDELSRRWIERFPEAAEAETIIPPAATMPKGAVFISYASQDLAAVQKLKAGLNAVGLPVWFDKAQLGAGDSFDAKIEKNILDCSCFVAVLSQTTEHRMDAWFRREWHFAIQRSTKMDSSTPFIVPVCIDDTRQFEHASPEILARTRTDLPGGHVTPEFTEQMQRIVAGYMARTRMG